MNTFYAKKNSQKFSQKLIAAFALCSTLASTLTSQNAQAYALDWTGAYRFEYTEVDRTSLGDPKMRKAYFLHHLNLNPRIIASDGVNITARFDVLSNDKYPSSQVGQTFGSNNRTNATSSTGMDSNVNATHQRESTLKVSQLYLSINQEYGAFLAGRAPKQFGLGMTYNAGNGAFDHWYDTHDVVGYKFVIGNLFIMPMVARVYDESLGQGLDVSDTIWHVEYNNPETKSTIALYHQSRNGTFAVNDAPLNYIGGTGATITGGWNTQNVNILFGRGFDTVDFKIEAGFTSGNTGVTTATNETVNVNGFGVATEINFQNPERKWNGNLKMGMASGDNPETANYEGYQFDRNYDVAFLMFNHPLGKYDLFTSGLQRNTDSSCTTAPCSQYATDNAVDEEAISNVVYVSPTLTREISDRWTWTNTFTYAQLQANPLVGNNVSKDVGYEIDTGLIYKPTDKITWMNQLGFFFPGSAFVGGTSGYEKGFTYGFVTKAAISF